MVSEEEFQSLLSRHNKLTAAFRRLAENLTASDKEREKAEKLARKTELSMSTKIAELDNKILILDDKIKT